MASFILLHMEVTQSVLVRCSKSTSEYCIDKWCNQTAQVLSYTNWGYFSGLHCDYRYVPTIQQVHAYVCVFCYIISLLTCCNCLLDIYDPKYAGLRNRITFKQDNVKWLYSKMTLIMVSSKTTVVLTWTRYLHLLIWEGYLSLSWY